MCATPARHRAQRQGVVHSDAGFWVAPTVTVFGMPIFKLGGAPVKLVSSVTLGIWTPTTCLKRRL